MTVTAAAANKIVRELNNQLLILKNLEDQSEKFNASVGEDPEDVRPDYDFRSVQDEIERIEKKIRKIKHAINVFNSSTIVPKFDVTIDQILIWMPQISDRKKKLEKMASRIPKIRVNQYGSNIIDYQIINYDLAEVGAELDKQSNLLNDMQSELDVINNTVSFEI